MKNELSKNIDDLLIVIQGEKKYSHHYSPALEIFNNDNCVILSQSASLFEIIVSNKGQDHQVKLEINPEGIIVPLSKEESTEWGKLAIAALLKVQDELSKTKFSEINHHKQYTREGMIHRVLTERKEKALKEDYRIKWADNIYGDHLLYNNKGSKYLVFLRDFENETGYSDSADAKNNKLGTTKHIMAAFHQLKTNDKLFAKMDKTCPFVEIYLDPLHQNQITWFYPHELAQEIKPLIEQYFGNQNFIPESQTLDFLGFLEESSEWEDLIKIRPEVREKLDTLYEEEMMGWIQEKYDISYDNISATLYPYQKEGVSFITYRKGCILADEMGLGKTLQAITAAVAKKSIFSFRKTLIICPASLKDQWKKEIERFSQETAEIIDGTPDVRAKQYQDSKSYFLITNYEAVLRDALAINKANIDFLILDEAQRIKNFETKTWSSINRLQKKHILVLTGTPIENKLVDIYSIMQTIDPNLLGPLWEFSYQHCLFDSERKDKINGYYDLQKVKKTLEPVLLRREKRKVLEQLPNISQMDVFVELTMAQKEYHAGYAKALSKIIRKKFLTPADLTRMQMILASMRMVCDSTYLIDSETNDSSKLEELKDILLEKLQIKSSNNKIIIFSEWVKCHKLIGEILRQNDIGFAELNGTVPVNKRGALIKTFETDDKCKVFLSTEAGGSGLNLQVADTLINFELPWNPAKKNQRIGRIDRLGQKSKHLTIINLIAKNSIEMQIASGLMVKQNLFDGVLNGSNTNMVDFSEKGRSQFLIQLENMINELELPVQESEPESVTIEEEEQEQEVAQQLSLFDEKVEGAPITETEQVIQKTNVQSKEQEVEQMVAVMNQGLGFLSGLFKMATGNDMNSSDQTIEINKETGEVTMKFKLPGF